MLFLRSMHDPLHECSCPAQAWRLRECAEAARVAALLRPRVAQVPLNCRAELAAAERTISRLRRGLLNTAERAALRRRLPGRGLDMSCPAAPGDRNAEPPVARKLYAPDPPGRGWRLDAMA